MFRLLKMMFSPTPRWISAVEKNGTPAKATVLAESKEVQALKGGLGYEGSDGWVKLPVQVQRTDGSTYEAEMTCKLSQALFGLLEKGSQVNVRVDPQDQSRVLLVDDVNTLLQSRVVK